MLSILLCNFKDTRVKHLKYVYLRKSKHNLFRIIDTCTFFVYSKFPLFETAQLCHCEDSLHQRFWQEENQHAVFEDV